MGVGERRREGVVGKKAWAWEGVVSVAGAGWILVVVLLKLSLEQELELDGRAGDGARSDGIF